MKPDGYITKPEAAALLGCKMRTVDNWMKRGLIPYYKMSRSVFYKREEVLASIARFKVASRSSAVEQAPYKGQVVGSIPTETTSSEAACNNAWDEVCRWLRIAGQSTDAKKRNLANETLKFVLRFEV